MKKLLPLFAVVVLVGLFAGSMAAAPRAKPYAKPGHYSGKTSQMEKVELVISRDGRKLISGTWWYNMSCDPPDRISLHEDFFVRRPFTLKRDGSAKTSADDIDEIPSDKHSLVLSFRFTKSGKVSGKFKVNATEIHDSTTFTCWSGDQTFTASWDRRSFKAVPHD
jgi:hypothetical protein